MLLVNPKFSAYCVWICKISITRGEKALFRSLTLGGIQNESLNAQIY